VVDLGSTNGTTLNGKPIRRGHLRHGDRLQLGDLCLVYEMLSSEEVAHLRQVTERLQAKDRDPLTGLLTRAYLQEELPAQLERCQEQAIPLGCLFIDVDRFKAINDGFGHAVGDDVLVSTARIVALGVRDRDACVRYGGEEFLVVLEGATEYRAAVVANRVRQAVAKHDWSRTAAELAVTVSIGVAVCQPKESQRAWLERADQALYRAKQAGRNRVVRAKTVRTVRPK
jgi:diguanylate cyclase (GGDEF)-like protein